MSGGKLRRLPQMRSIKRDGTQIATLAVAMRFVVAFLSPACSRSAMYRCAAVAGCPATFSSANGHLDDLVRWNGRDARTEIGRSETRMNIYSGHSRIAYGVGREGNESDALFLGKGS